VYYDEDDDLTVSHKTMTKRMKHLSKVLSHFWKRWHDEHLLSLKDCHRYNQGSEGTKEVSQGDVILTRFAERDLKQSTRPPKEQQLRRQRNGCRVLWMNFNNSY